MHKHERGPGNDRTASGRSGEPGDSKQGGSIQWRRLISTIGLTTMVGVSCYAIGHYGLKGAARGAYHEVRSIISPDISEKCKTLRASMVREDDIDRYQGDLFALADSIYARCNQDSVAQHLAATPAVNYDTWKEALAAKAAHGSVKAVAGLAEAVLKGTPTDSLYAVGDSVGNALAGGRGVLLTTGVYSSLAGGERGDVEKYIIKDGLVRIKNKVVSTLDTLLR